MLIDDTAKIGWDCNDPILAALAAIDGRDPKPEHVMQGNRFMWLLFAAHYCNDIGV